MGIVERLRKSMRASDICNEAADEIERLRTELDLCKPHPNCDQGCMLSCQQEANYAKKLEKELAELREKLNYATAVIEQRNGEITNFLAALQHEKDAAEAYKAEADALRKDAERYRWLRIKGLQRAWVSLGTDCDGDNFADFKCEFRVPEPPNLPYEDDEGLEWADKDFDASIDAAIQSSEVKK